MGPAPIVMKVADDLPSSHLLGTRVNKRARARTKVQRTSENSVWAKFAEFLFHAPG
jgi:hypothetical protein